MNEMTDKAMNEMINKSKVTNLLIVGVGGQGILLASRILANAAMRAGYDVKVSEVHGMAQRGGSVVTHVRFGDKVYSPLVSRGQADIILAFERLEALRWLPYSKDRDGIIIINDLAILPLPVILGKENYPEDIPGLIAGTGRRLVLIDASGVARTLGNMKAANVVLLGVLAQHLNLSKAAWEEAIVETVPARILLLNRQAFEEGLLKTRLFS